MALEAVMDALAGMVSAPASVRPARPARPGHLRATTGRFALVNINKKE